MSETAAFNLFVEPMRRRFTVPSGLDPEAFTADLTETLADYSDHQLETAAKHFRDTRTARVFPTIAECRQACERYTAQPQAILGPKYETDDMRRAMEHTIRERRFAGLKLCRNELGRQADREGWLGLLIEFAGDNGRMPVDREIAELKSKAKAMDESLERLRPPVKGSSWTFKEQSAFFESMTNLRRTMRDRYHNDVFAFGERMPERPRGAEAKEEADRVRREEGQKAYERLATEVDRSPVLLGEGLAQKIAGMREAAE